MEIDGKITEVLPANTLVGAKKELQLQVEDFFPLILYQGRWEDSRQKSNCRICNIHISLPEHVVGKNVTMQFTYDSNCMIDIQVILDRKVEKHMKVKDKWYNDRSDDPLCVIGESETLRMNRRRNELIIRCEDMQEKLRNNSSPDIESVSLLHNKINTAPGINELNIYGLKLAEFEKKWWIVCC